MVEIPAEIADADQGFLILKREFSLGLKGSVNDLVDKIFFQTLLSMRWQKQTLLDT
jgi:hypothetical protein